MSTGALLSMRGASGPAMCRPISCGNGERRLTSGVLLRRLAQIEERLDQIWATLAPIYDRQTQDEIARLRYVQMLAEMAVADRTAQTPRSERRSRPRARRKELRPGGEVRAAERDEMQRWAARNR